MSEVAFVMVWRVEFDALGKQDNSLDISSNADTLTNIGWMLSQRGVYVEAQ